MSEKSVLLSEISEMLMDSDVFKNLPSAEVQTAARYFSISEIEEGKEIFHEGDIGTFMCIINAGKVSVLKSNLEEERIEIAVLHQGRAFGEMAVLDGERRSATCVAATNCILLTLSRDLLDKMLAESPRTAARVIRAVAVSLSKRLRMADGKLIDRRYNCAY
jgi:CRP-like cAMP-binding protein